MQLAFAGCCDNRWIFNPQTGSYYLFGTDFVTWFQAAAICRSLCATLVQVNNANEQIFITNYLTQHPLDFNITALRVQTARLMDGTPVIPTNWDGTVVWSGMNVLQTERVWRWQGSNALVTYTNWAPGEPNNWQGMERCGHFYANRGNNNRFPLGSWNDLHCYVLGTFICKRAA
jgi:hypothetical protein